MMLNLRAIKIYFRDNEIAKCYSIDEFQRFGGLVKKSRGAQVSHLSCEDKLAVALQGRSDREILLFCGKA